NQKGDGRTIVTTALSDDLIYGVEDVDGVAQLSAQYVQIECDVVAGYGNTQISLRDVAEITKDLDENRNEVMRDRDRIRDGTGCSAGCRSDRFRIGRRRLVGRRGHRERITRFSIRIQALGIGSTVGVIGCR